MKNELFNKKLKHIFNVTSSDQHVIDMVSELWIKNTTTKEQDAMLDELKADASKGLASCAERYFLNNK